MRFNPNMTSHKFGLSANSFWQQNVPLKFNHVTCSDLNLAKTQAWVPYTKKKTKVKMVKCALPN